MSQQPPPPQRRGRAESVASPPQGRPAPVDSTASNKSETSTEEAATTTSTTTTTTKTEIVASDQSSEPAAAPRVPSSRPPPPPQRSDSGTSKPPPPPPPPRDRQNQEGRSGSGGGPPPPPPPPPPRSPASAETAPSKGPARPPPKGPPSRQASAAVTPTNRSTTPAAEAETKPAEVSSTSSAKTDSRQETVTTETRATTTTTTASSNSNAGTQQQPENNASATNTDQRRTPPPSSSNTSAGSQPAPAQKAEPASNADSRAQQQRTPDAEKPPTSDQQSREQSQTTTTTTTTKTTTTTSSNEQTAGSRRATPAPETQKESTAAPSGKPAAQGEEEKQQKGGEEDPPKPGTSPTPSQRPKPKPKGQLAQRLQLAHSSGKLSVVVSRDRHQREAGDVGALYGGVHNPMLVQFTPQRDSEKEAKSTTNAPPPAVTVRLVNPRPLHYDAADDSLVDLDDTPIASIGGAMTFVTPGRGVTLGGDQSMYSPAVGLSPVPALQSPARVVDVQSHYIQQSYMQGSNSLLTTRTAINASSQGQNSTLYTRPGLAAGFGPKASKLLWDFFQTHSVDGMTLPFSRYALLIHRLNRHNVRFRLQDALSFFRNRHGVLSEMAHKPLSFFTFCEAVAHFLREEAQLVNMSQEEYIEAVLGEIIEMTSRELEIISRDDCVYCATTLEWLSVNQSDVAELFRVLALGGNASSRPFLGPETVYVAGTGIIRSVDRSAVGNPSFLAHSPTKQVFDSHSSVTHHAFISRLYRTGVIPANIKGETASTMLARRSGRMGLLKFHELQLCLGSIARRCYGSGQLTPPVLFVSSGTPRKGATDDVGLGTAEVEMKTLLSNLLKA